VCGGIKQAKRARNQDKKNKGVTIKIGCSIKSIKIFEYYKKYELNL